MGSAEELRVMAERLELEPIERSPTGPARSRSMRPSAGLGRSESHVAVECETPVVMQSGLRKLETAFFAHNPRNRGASVSFQRNVYGQRGQGSGRPA
jgi:hypothetical protein